MSEDNKNDSPIAVDLVKDKNYSWCTCSHSSDQPFCDGTHRFHDATPPMRFSVEEDKTAYLCTCKKTSNPPYCDGSHNK